MSYPRVFRAFLSGSFLTAMALNRPAHGKDKEQSERLCYIWGNGYYQARPGSSGGLSFANFTPKKIEDLTTLKLKSLFFNDYFEGGLNDSGEVYLWDIHRIASTLNDAVDDTKRQNIVKVQSPDKSGVKSVHFTKQYMWILTGKGEVYQYPIDKKINAETQEIENIKLNQTPRKIKSLQKIKQIETGEDHVVVLDETGLVYTMGDDTNGQCGVGANKRSTAPPFYEQRIGNPTQLTTLPPILRISCGSNHTLAIGVEGGIYGWGSNSKMQLSQQQEYSKVDQPLIAVFQPLRISSIMEQNNKAIDAVAGNEFTIMITENFTTGETEVFGCGHNLKGEIGAGFVRHLSDIVKIEGLSNYKIKSEKGEENVRIKQISCGKYHCMALTSIGALLEWGDNEHGQMGNKKRSTTDNPIVMSTFSKESIFSIACSNLSSGVIISKNKNT